MIYDSRQLDAYLAAHYRAHLRPHGPIRLTGMGDGFTRCDEWPEELLGRKQPTPEEVHDWYAGKPEPEAKPNHAAIAADKLAAAKEGTQVAKIAALTECVEAMQGVLRAHKLM